MVKALKHKQMPLKPVTLWTDWFNTATQPSPPQDFWGKVKSNKSRQALPSDRQSHQTSVFRIEKKIMNFIDSPKGEMHVVRRETFTMTTEDARKGTSNTFVALTEMLQSDQI